MQIYSFERLGSDSKVCLTWKQGVNIGYRTEGNYYMCLYRLCNFYVEIQYHTCYDGIACIKAFDNEELLQPYLEQVDLSFVV